MQRRVLAQPEGQQTAVVAGNAKQAQTDHQHAGDRAALEGHVQCRRNAPACSLGGTHIGPHGNVHADEACRPGKYRTNDEADRRRHAKEHGNQHRHYRTDHGDGLVLPVQVGSSTFLDRLGNFLHALVSRWQGQNGTTGQPTVDDRHPGT